MKYQKPEIAPLASAMSAIECTNAKTGGPTDCPPSRPHKTAAAYEADE